VCTTKVFFAQLHITSWIAFQQPVFVLQSGNGDKIWQLDGQKMVASLA